MTSLELAKHLFLFLNSSHIDYVIVGDTRGYPDEIQSDIDIVVDAQALRVFRQRFLQYCSIHRLKIVQTFRHEYSSWYFVLSGIDEKGKICFLQPDVCGDYFRFGRLFLKAEQLLNGRTKTNYGVNGVSPFYIPAPAIGFIYYLLKKIDKGNINGRHGDYLNAEWKKDPAGALVQLNRFWPNHEAALIANAAENNSWTAISFTLPHLQRTLRRSLPFSFQQMGLEFIRRMLRVTQPTGIHVVFLGADGSGKSTIIEQVERDLAPAFRKTKRYHFRPFFGLTKERGAQVNDPHAQPLRGPLLSLVRLSWWWMDYTVGYLVEVVPRMARSTIVLFDRYYHDLLVDNKRYRYGGPAWAAKLGERLIPRPDLIILLDAPAEIVRMRKQEIPTPEIHRQRLAYIALLEKLPNSFLVDASQPFNKVLAQVETAIVDYLEKRTTKRLKRVS